MLTGNNSIKNKITPEEFIQMKPEEKIMKITEGWATPAGKTEGEALNFLLTKMETVSPAKTIKLKYMMQAAAAVIITLIGIYSVSATFFKEKEVTKFAEQKEFLLPDGSNVVLNAGSKITWSEKHFAESRHLTLRGEAYFEVKKGNKFVIKTKNGTVEILGTQLDVYSRGDEFRVSCISGKVSVKANNQQQIINPGEIAEITSGGLEKRVINNVGQTSVWRQGIFYFEDKPVVSIFAELERQFNVSVNFKGMEDRSITVAFSNKNLNEALDIICIPMGFAYEIENRKVTIYEKPK